jgi:adenylate cyclase
VVRRYRRQRLRLLLLGLVAFLGMAAGAVAYLTRSVDRLERETVDTRFSWRGTEKPPRNLVVVGVDHATIVDLDLPIPWPRRADARVIDRLHRDGATVVALDYAYDQASREPKAYCPFAADTLPPDDCALLTSAGRARNLVFGADAVLNHGNVPFIGSSDGKAVLQAIDARAGFAQLSNDPGGVARRFGHDFYGVKSLAVATVERRVGRGVSRSRFGADGTAWIDFYGPPGTIRQVPYWKVYRGITPPGFFRGKTVIVGNVDPALHDVFFTSTSGSQVMSGAELWANAIGTVQRGFPLRPASDALNLLLIVLLAVIAPIASIRLSPLRMLPVVLLAGGAYVVATWQAFDEGTILAFVYPLGALVVTAVGALAVHYFTETRERQRTKLLFARFVPANVVDEVLERTDDDLRIGGIQRDGTVMFCDLRGFTSFAESLPVERVIEVLNRYLGEMSEAILGNGGTLVAYMGDGIMAVFGAPIEQGDHADRALRTAREMMGARLAAFNRWLREAGFSESGFRMGIGLNSGPVMSGNVGSQQRLEYTAIGDTTNTASRIEAMTKGTSHTVLLSEATKERLHGESPDVLFVGEFEIRGRQEAIGLWTIADGTPSGESTEAAAPAPAG